MRNQLRAHYLSIANASENAEPDAPDWPNDDWSQDLPLDTPDWDWPDAPDPRFNDRGSPVVLYLLGCFAVIIASLAYLAWQAL